jgi:hypothetical protein
MVVCEGARALAPAPALDSLSPYDWHVLEITVAASSSRAQLVGHFTRRMATLPLPAHAAAAERLRAQTSGP